MNNNKKYIATAPGTLMVSGEYSVLCGHNAVICAVNRYINIELIPNSNSKYITIVSDNFGLLRISLDQIKWIKNTDNKFKLILYSIYEYINLIPHGFTIKIKSQFSHLLGLGSSAAVTVCMVNVLTQWINDISDIQGTRDKINHIDIFKKSLNITRKLHKFASGADIAASIYGGVVSYRAEPLTIEKIANHIPIVAIYSGTKKKTSEMVKYVLDSYDIAYIKDITYQASFITNQIITAIKFSNYGLLAKLYKKYNDLLYRSLDLSNQQLDNILQLLSDCGKISGAGNGDCVIAMSYYNFVQLENLFKNKLPSGSSILPISASSEGLLSYKEIIS